MSKTTIRSDGYGVAPQGRSGWRTPKKIRRARVLDDDHVDRVIQHIRATSNSPVSDELKVLLSVYAGPRDARTS